MTDLLLFFIGFFAGAYGIMIGAGGGFIFVPALLILLQMSPEMAAGTGLVVVLINALSGIHGYFRQRRIDYRTGIILGIGATPGTFLGVWLTEMISPLYFYWVFAGVLVALGLFLLIKKLPENKGGEGSTAADPENPQTDWGSKNSTLLLFLIGILLGVVSSFFGIGGGWLLVPILIYIFRMSPHHATATSIFSLCLYSAVGVGIHLVQGNIAWMAVLWGGLGILAGAQLGVYLSNRISGRRIIQMLSIILIIVGIKLFFN